MTFGERSAVSGWAMLFFWICTLATYDGGWALAATAAAGYRVIDHYREMRRRFGR